MKTQCINVWGQGFGPAAELPLGVPGAKQMRSPELRLQGAVSVTRF